MGGSRVRAKTFTAREAIEREKGVRTTKREGRGAAMTKPRTEYTEEYRRETADYIISTGQPVVAVAAELGFHQKTASRWTTLRKKALNGEVFTLEEDAELRALRKRNRELEMENEFLKKPQPSDGLEQR